LVIYYLHHLNVKEIVYLQLRCSKTPANESNSITENYFMEDF